MSRINRLFNWEDLEQVERDPMVEKMKRLVHELKEKGLATTSRGCLEISNLNDKNYENTVYPMRSWEYSTVVSVCQITRGEKVLECGGSSSPLVFYLAQMGVRVTTIELQRSLVENARKVAQTMVWNIDAQLGDLTQLKFQDESFDRVLCVSVLEHIVDRLKKKGMAEMARVLKPGGILAVTFDYGSSTGWKHHPLRSLTHIREVLVKPSGLEICGGERLSEPQLNKAVPIEFPAYLLRFIRGGYRTEKALRSVLRMSYPKGAYYCFGLFLEKRAT